MDRNQQWRQQPAANNSDSKKQRQPHKSENSNQRPLATDIGLQQYTVAKNYLPNFCLENANRR